MVESTPAWRMAHEAAVIPGVRLRALSSVEDADKIVRVMEAVWGEAPPRDLIRALAGSGNVPIGAFDGADLIGFALGWAAVDPKDGLHVYSHMLAALPDSRHRGVGFALKLAQRALALDQGIRLMRWTFDPLVSRNAYFNLHKLGAIADRFEPDYYGEMTDAINRGDRSDRLVIRWDLDRTPGSRPHVHAGELVALRSVGPVDAPHPELREEPSGAAGLSCYRSRGTTSPSVEAMLLLRQPGERRSGTC